eukprot:8592592-Pyramimonas_sp.AAC.1
METRDHDLLARKLIEHGQVPDIYTAGWPCQPFSVSGLQLGIDDPRGGVGISVVKTIEAVKPKSFVLENVPAVKYNSKFNPLYKLMIQRLSSMKQDALR